GDHDHRRTGHELHQAVVKRLALVRGVMRLGQRRADLHEFHADDLQALFLESVENPPAKPAMNGVGLEDYERALHWILLISEANGLSKEKESHAEAQRRREETEVREKQGAFT